MAMAIFNGESYHGGVNGSMANENNISWPSLSNGWPSKLKCNMLGEEEIRINENGEWRKRGGESGCGSLPGSSISAENTSSGYLYQYKRKKINRRNRKHQLANVSVAGRRENVARNIG
jgi:hypothetical protein